MNKTNLIKKKRIEKNLTQEYVASQIGISTKTLSRIENHRRPLKVFELKALCNILNLDPNVFVEDQEEKDRLLGLTEDNEHNDYGKYLSPSEFISEIKNLEFKLLILKAKLYKELKSRG